MGDYEYSDYGSENSERLHLLDYLLILISIVLILVPSLFGFSFQSTTNQTVQKEHHFKELFVALDKYFVDSNSIPSERKYPQSVCSGMPNESDFEYTLKNHLTGKVREIVNHTYIQPADFPLDPFGEYSVSKSERKFPLRKCEQIYSIQESPNLIYDLSYKSCNYKRDSQDTKYRNCYLYATDDKGFKYQLAYYNEVSDKYTIYSKYREDPRTKISSLR